MGNREDETSAKTARSSSAQEQTTPNAPSRVFPDWASFQAYYNSAESSPISAHAFYPSPVASSPQGHPYICSPRGSYRYGAFAITSSNKTNHSSVVGGGGAEVHGKKSEIGNVSGASANGSASQSGDSGSGSSSEGSDANSKNAAQKKRCHEKDMACGDTVASESGGASQATQSPTVSNHISPIIAIPPGAITAPSTTLNIGMDYWGGPSPASVGPLQSKLPITPRRAAVDSACDAVPSDLSLQDKRELKRQKRKQSNRESAHRSRLRKQAECEELAQRAGFLKEENDGLREELIRLRVESEKLASENASLTERLKKYQ